MRILISAFEAFGGSKLNSSEIVLSNVQRKARAFKNVRCILLPVSFEKAFPALLKEVRSFKPDIILSLGQAEKRKYLSFETVAQNLIRARIADNDRTRPSTRKIRKKGPNRLRSSLDPRLLLQSFKSYRLRSRISRNAGGFVCNFLFYKSLFLFASKKRKRMQIAFVHLPLVKEQGGKCDARVIAEALLEFSLRRNQSGPKSKY